MTSQASNPWHTPAIVATVLTVVLCGGMAAWLLSLGMPWPLSLPFLAVAAWPVAVAYRYRRSAP